jgi:hypothetical protein
MKKHAWYRLALSILLFFAVWWFWSSRFDELSYHTIAKSELVDMGDASTYASREKSIPFNSYVSVTGILGNKAATLRGLRAGSLRFGRYQVRHLLGSKIYIEYHEGTYHKKFQPFTRVDVQGRLVSFGPGSELQKVRDFFEKYHNVKIDNNAMLVVIDEKPRSEILYSLIFLITMIVLVISFYFSLRDILAKSKSLEGDDNKEI